MSEIDEEKLAADLSEEKMADIEIIESDASQNIVEKNDDIAVEKKFEEQNVDQPMLIPSIEKYSPDLSDEGLESEFISHQDLEVKISPEDHTSDEEMQTELLIEFGESINIPIPHKLKDGIEKPPIMSHNVGSLSPFEFVKAPPPPDPKELHSKLLKTKQDKLKKQKNEMNLEISRNEKVNELYVEDHLIVFDSPAEEKVSDNDEDEPFQVIETNIGLKVVSPKKETGLSPLTSPIDFKRIGSTHEILNDMILISPNASPNKLTPNSETVSSANTSPDKMAISSPDRMKISSPEKMKISSPDKTIISSPENMEIPSQVKKKISSPDKTIISSPDNMAISSPEKVTISSPVEMKISSPNQTLISFPDECSEKVVSISSDTNQENVTITSIIENTETETSTVIDMDLSPEVVSPNIDSKKDEGDKEAENVKLIDKKISTRVLISPKTENCSEKLRKNFDGSDIAKNEPPSSTLTKSPTEEKGKSSQLSSSNCGQPEKSEHPCDSSLDEEEKTSKCSDIFGVRSYLHQFYEKPSFKDPDLYEDDDLRYLLNPNRKRPCCHSIWWKIFVWIGVNFLIFGVIGVLVGYLVPPKTEIVGSSENNIEVLDTQALQFNENLDICKLVGVILFCIGGMTLTIALLFPSFLHQYCVEEHIESCYKSSKNENHPIKSPLDNVIPSSACISSVQPVRYASESVVTKEGLQPVSE